MTFFAVGKTIERFECVFDVFIKIMTAGRFELLAEFFKTSVCKIENALLI